MQISWLFSQLPRRQQNLISRILTPVEYFMAFIDYFYPKRSNIILFGSDNGEFASGSPKALFDYMHKNHLECETLFYSPFMQKGFIAKLKYSIRFAPLFFRARFLVSSHPPKDFFPFFWSSKKFFINAWHGIPLKAMFFSDKGEKKDSLKGILRLNKKTSAFLVASSLEAELMAKCFRLEPSKFWCLGHPRNDLLKKNSKSNVLRKIMQGKVDYDKVILYCPTYRRDAPTIFFPFADLNLKNLNEFLDKNKVLILIRDHIYSKTTSKHLYSERIIPFGFNVCADVNSILSEVDMLITDYSSIYFDFLLLDKPCIFIPYDLENYTKKRGFLLNYDYWSPGPKVLTYRSFIKEVEEALSYNDNYKNKRKTLQRRLHTCQTENSCEKIVQLIKSWK